jgi:hypothetical protein
MLLFLSATAGKIAGEGRGTVKVARMRDYRTCTTALPGAVLWHGVWNDI